MARSSKGCKPGNFKSHYSVKRSLRNTGCLHLNFVECESLLELNSPESLAICERNLDNSIDFSNFPVRDYLPIIGMDFITHLHCLAIDVNKGVSFYSRLISRKLCRFLLMYLTGLISLSVLLLFLLSITFFSLMHNF